jgi:hypothetical protein
MYEECRNCDIPRYYKGENLEKKCRVCINETERRRVAYVEFVTGRHWSKGKERS